jgi:hypothetical protein
MDDNNFDVDEADDEDGDCSLADMAVDRLVFTTNFFCRLFNNDAESGAVEGELAVSENDGNENFPRALMDSPVDLDDVDTDEIVDDDEG